MQCKKKKKNNLLVESKNDDKVIGLEPIQTVIQIVVKTINARTDGKKKKPSKILIIM